MTDPKERLRSGLRAPRPKKTLGLQVPQPLRLPHEDLILAPEHEAPEPRATLTPTPDVGVNLVETPTDSVAPTPNVAPTESVTPTPNTSEPQRRVGVTQNVALTRNVGVRPSSLYYRMPNSIADELMPKLGASEQLVYFQLYRLSWGHQRTTCKVSVPKLAERCNMGTTAVRAALRKLERDGHVTPLGTDFGASNKQDRGLEFQVNLPEGTPTESVAPTRNVGATDSVAPTPSVAMKYIKENNKKGLSNPDVYELRTIAARIYEVRRGEPGFTHDRLREAVRDVVIGENRDVDDALIDEAIKGMAL